MALCLKCFKPFFNVLYCQNYYYYHYHYHYHYHYCYYYYYYYYYDDDYYYYCYYYYNNSRYRDLSGVTPTGIFVYRSFLFLIGRSDG